MWRKGNTYLVEGPTLRLKDMTTNMTGLYESVVFNGFGEPAVKYYKINVHKKKDNMKNNSQGLLEYTWLASPTRYKMNSSSGVELISISNCKYFSSSLHCTAFASVVLFAF